MGLVGTAAWSVMASEGTGAIAPADRLEIERTTVCAISDEATSVTELTGVIKWFDMSKGYGFIVPDNGCPMFCCT
jgi:hypothetical protein